LILGPRAKLETKRLTDGRDEANDVGHRNLRDKEYGLDTKDDADDDKSQALTIDMIATPERPTELPAENKTVTYVSTEET